MGIYILCKTNKNTLCLHCILLGEGWGHQLSGIEMQDTHLKFKYVDQQLVNELSGPVTKWPLKKKKANDVTINSERQRTWGRNNAVYIHTVVPPPPLPRRKLVPGEFAQNRFSVRTPPQFISHPRRQRDKCPCLLSYKRRDSRKIFLFPLKEPVCSDFYLRYLNCLRDTRVLFI